MSETVILLLACLAGAALGTLFFGGLWWTVRKTVSSQRPAQWVLGSTLLRMGIALSGLYFVADGQVGRLLACLAGFLGARLVVTWLTRLPPQALPIAPQRQERHAS